METKMQVGDSMAIPMEAPDQSYTESWRWIGRWWGKKERKSFAGVYLTNYEYDILHIAIVLTLEQEKCCFAVLECGDFFMLAIMFMLC